MKINYEDKKEIYRKWKEGWSTKELSKEYKINESSIKYMVRLVNKHGIDIIRREKNRKYSKELKEEIINKVLLEGNSTLSTSLNYALPSKGMLPNWIANYKQNGYTIVENTIGRPSKMGIRPKKKLEEMTEIERLREELEYLRTENVYLKKLRALRLKEEAEERERQKLLEKWSQEDID